MNLAPIYHVIVLILSPLKVAWCFFQEGCTGICRIGKPVVTSEQVLITNAKVWTVWRSWGRKVISHICSVGWVDKWSKYRLGLTVTDNEKSLVLHPRGRANKFKLQSSWFPLPLVHGLHNSCICMSCVQTMNQIPSLHLSIRNPIGWNHRFLSCLRSWGDYACLVATSNTTIHSIPFYLFAY